MQIIINFSKNLILVVLTFVMMTTWYNGETEIINLQPMSSSYDNNASYGDASGQSVWQIMSAEFKLDTRAQSSQVQNEIRKLLAEPNEFYNALKSAVPYIYYINQQTKERGLPAEIALIPVIESEFDPYDHSNKGASGLWQLMTETAHELGIKVKSGYDGRLNVIASTHAALAYFNDLGHDFNGNWYLAIAAYNCGQDRVKSAMRKTGSDSFWNLPLPQETKFYVPRLLAVAEIIKHPAKYGVTLPYINNAPYFKTITVTKAVNLNQVAQSADVNVKTLNQLNPDYTRNSHAQVAFAAVKAVVKKENTKLAKTQAKQVVTSTPIIISNGTTNTTSVVKTANKIINAADANPSQTQPTKVKLQPALTLLVPVNKVSAVKASLS